ncbi:MAG: response regulator [Bacteroidota bacterium]|nr:response regulator [Bacteroidota bacterium]
MKVVEILINYIKKNNKTAVKKNYLFSVLLTSYFTFSIVTSLIAIFILLAEDRFQMALILLTYLILNVGIVLYYKVSEVNMRILGHMVLSVNMVLSLFFLVTGGETDVALHWLGLFPIIAILLFPEDNGELYSVLLFLFAVTWFLIPIESVFVKNYTVEVAVRFSLIYLFIMFFVATYRKITDSIANRTEKEYLDYKKEIHAKDELISDLSFKMRIPLGHLVGILNLKEDTDNEDLIDEIESGVDSLVGIVNSIPSLSGVKGLKKKQRRTFFNFNKSLKQTLNLFDNSDYRGLAISTNMSASLPSTVYADLTTMKQILIGLIDFFYTNTNEGPVNLDLVVSQKSSNEKESEVLFKIQNEEPLEVIENNKLGNFINNVYDIDIAELIFVEHQVNKMDGKLNIYSDEGGTAFLFSIKLELEKTTEAVHSLSDADTTYKKTEQEAVKTKDSNILLVEDDKVNQKIMVLTLKKYVNEIEVAQNGREAIEMLENKKYDLILMDIRMPFMDGFKTTKKIRETEAGTSMHVPIIAVTANALEGDKEKCLDSGMDEYMSKPFRTDELLEKMEALLGVEV